jgi:hypothetical protein
MQSKISPSNYSDRHVNYMHWGILLLIALPVAHFIVTESQHKPMLVLIRQHNYHVAMIFSWPVTFLLMFWVHYITKKLDVFAPWTSKWFKRVCLQFLLGVLLVLVVDVIVVKAYFSVLGGNFEKSGYMQIEFPIIRWMVLFLNSFYIAWFFSVKYFESKKINDRLTADIDLLNKEKEITNSYAQKIEAQIGTKVLLLDVDDIAYFERDENVGYVYLSNGEKLNIDYKMHQLVAMLDPTLFYKIDRSLMISFTAVRGYEKLRDRRGKIIFQDDFKMGEELILIRDVFYRFKKRFDAFGK